jgi:hypothetical protein
MGWPHPNTNYIHTDTPIQCRVMGILTGTYGKFAAEDYDRVVIMEYDYLLQTLLPYNVNPTPPTEFNDWIIANPQIM